MDPKKDMTEQMRKTVTAGVIALAVVSLLAGASVSATLEEYAAPEFAESDPFEGAVDDLTGEDTWDEKDPHKSDDGARPLIRKAMKNRMDDRMEDRTEHLEKRIEIDIQLITAFQFCLDSADCTADSESLSEMIEKLTWAVDGMQAKVDGTDSVVDADKDSSQDECEEAGGTWTTDDRKGEYCSVADYKDWDERKDWDETERMEFAEQKSTQLSAAQEAIVFCIESADCSAEPETIETALGHMISRAEHHRACADDRRCDRDHDMRKGFRGRMGGALCKMLDRCEDREKYDGPPSIEVTQEMCESRMGVWTEAADRGEGVFYCDWSGLADQPEGEESDEDEREEGSESGESNQEECEASGGTWYEDRQYCDTE